MGENIGYLDNKCDEHRVLLATIADTGGSLLVFYGTNPGLPDR